MILKSNNSINPKEAKADDKKSLIKVVLYYALRASMLLVYVIVGLVLFALELVWNHGFFGGGAELIPTLIEYAIFILWAIGGLVGLFFICEKRIARSIYTIIISCGILGIVFAAGYVFGETLPNMKKSYEIHKLRSNAEVEFDVDTKPGTAYHTFFFDEDSLQLSQWARYEKDVAKAYNWIYFYHGEESDMTLDELPLSQIRYKTNFEAGVLLCFSDENYYDSIDFMYLEYKGRIYYFTGGEGWIGEELPDWKVKSEEMFRNRKEK